ncbi:site-2 protease family protein [Bacillus sp. JJ722]|uniref:site-2 protease family protein n=1 Tax=Bacillus sp. JJ722 TaxID=3122973 RepID=UPI002FFEAEDC
MKKIFTPLNMCLLLISIGIVLSFSSYSETVNFIGLTFIIALVVIFIHELGHVFGGKLAGYKFLYMTVGPITIKKDPNLKVVPNNTWITFGGVASCVPTEINLSDLVKRHTLFVAGGPILTVIASIISLAIWFVTENDVAMMFTILNTSIFFATAIPFQGTFKSDGSVFLLLQKGGKEVETFLAELLLMIEMMSPKSPIYWEKQLILEAKNVEVSIDTIMAAYSIFYYQLVTANYEKASESIASFKQLPITKKTKLHLQLITHIRQIDSLISSEPDIQFIKGLHSHMSKIDPISYKRSEAILTYLHGDVTSANQLLEEVMKECTKGIEQYGFYEAERQLTQIVQKALGKDMKCA